MGFNEAREALGVVFTVQNNSLIAATPRGVSVI